MKIEEISASVTYYVTTDGELYRRNGESLDAWEQLYYESWESLYDQETIDLLNKSVEEWKLKNDRSARPAIDD